MRFQLIAAAALAAVAALPAHAAPMVVFDQITEADYFGSGTASQDFEAAFDAFDVATVDDFTLGAAYTLTGFEAVLSNIGGGGNPAGITGYSVDFYSSRAAAGTSLTGDLGHFALAPADVSVTGYDASDSLYGAAINLALGAGTYYVAFVPTNDFGSNGQTYVSVGGAGDSFLANPNGGFGQGTTFDAAGNQAAAYRLYGSLAAGVPEPATWAMMIGGVGLMGGALRRRKPGTSVRFA